MLRQKQFRVKNVDFYSLAFSLLSVFSQFTMAKFHSDFLKVQVSLI